MTKNSLRIIHACIGAMLAMGLSSVSGAEPTPAGSIEFPAYVLPPSELSSPEMRAAYAKLVAEVDMKAANSIPAEDAPVEQWKAFWKYYDENIYAYAEKRAQELYPSKLEPKVIAGVETIVVTPKVGIDPRNAHRVIINVHGGGFFAGWGPSAVAGAIPVSSYLKAKVVTVNYRMSPKYRFPAASEDVAAVYKELLKQYPAQNIGIYGCSAGGILTAQAVAWFQAHGLPRPGAIGVACAGGGVSRASGDSARLWNTRGLPAVSNPTTFQLYYLKGTDPANDCLVSPSTCKNSRSVLAKFPPTLVLTATRDSAMSAAVVFHSQLLAAGAESQLYVIEGAWHGSHQQNPDPPESRDANAYTAKWFDQHLGTNGLAAASRK